MSAKNFKFVSPGVFVKEIDNSQLTKTAPPVGPVVIGRFRRGPAFLPTRIESLSELIQIFGEPIRGDESNDVWRGGIPTAPTYGAYAAAAWLKNGSPVTVVRVLGDQHPEVGSATDNSAAGWLMGSTPSNQENPGGAYGLFLQNPFPSASFGSTGSVEGVLAATWYFNSGGIILSGTLAPGAETSAYAPTVSGSMTLIKSSVGTSPAQTFTAQLFTSGSDNAGTPSDVLTFNFDRNSKYYIRKVFNTNPTLVNSSLVDSAAVKNYFLGETFEKSVATKITGTQCYGFIAPLATSTQGGHVFKAATRPGQTGWFMSQDMRTTAASSNVTENQLTPAFDADSAAICPRLFKFHTLSTGESEQKQFKISIENIKYSNRVDVDPYGTFSIVIRSLRDNDSRPMIVERYDNCNLNPNSDAYVARKVGDAYYEWDNTKKRITEYGTYPNNSNFIRIEVAESVELGTANPELLPFGVQGPLKRQDFQAQFTTGSTGGALNMIAAATASVLTHTASIYSAGDDSGLINIRSAFGNTFKRAATPVQFGALPIWTGADGSPRLNAIQSTLTGSTSLPGIIYANPGYMSSSIDNVMSASALAADFFHASDTSDQYVAYKTRRGGEFTCTYEFPSVFLRNNASDGNLSDPTLAYFGYSTDSGSLNTNFESSNLDLLRPLPTDYAQFAEGFETKRMFIFTLDDLSASLNGAYSYSSGSRATGQSVTARSGSYKDILDAGYDRFTSPLFGGFDGFDITEPEPLNNSRAIRDNATEKTYAMYYSVKKALDILADPEFVEMNLLAVPGITNESLTQHAVNICEDRADALAIIDPKGGYLPISETGGTEQSRISTNHVDEIVTNMQRRGMNSSYGCTYYPWVRMTDDISGGSLWAPPSIAAIGAMAFSDKQKALWFAPAGFNRGGLSRGAAGFPITNVRSKLTSGERDDLYENNVNPIASFPQEGIVIFGQKTLQVTPSALDRINVRRLMIYVKKQVSRIAADLLFDQNVQTTWNRFKAQVDPFLSNIRTAFGLTDFKVVLDETTTTPELIDRNIMYAKIFLKPARAIEYIAIDFNITNTGASFDD